MQKSCGLLLLICTFLLSSCKDVVNNGFSILGEDVFNTYQFTSNGKKLVKIEADLIKETKHLEIYLKKDFSMSQENVNYLANNFELHYDNMIDIYGTHTDIDKNGKIIILLYDINENYKQGQSYVGGYFNPNDLYSRESSPSSNEAEILYVECQVQNDIENIFGTVIHEFQHLINANMTYWKNGEQSEVWLNEALSCSAEIYLFDALQSYRQDNYNLDDKYKKESEATNSDKKYYSIAEGNNFYYWKNDIPDYATASVFMYWLYLNGGGTEIIKNIAQASAFDRTNYKAILNAIDASTSTAFDDLDSWEDVLIAWKNATEDVTNGFPDGKNSKGLDIDLDSMVYTESGTLNLYPGDIVLTNVATGTVSGITNSTLSSTGTHVTLNNTLETIAYSTSSADSITITVPEVSSVESASIVSSMSVLSMEADEGYKLVDPDYKIMPFGLISIEGLE